MTGFAGHDVLEAAAAPGGWAAAMDLLRRGFNAHHTMIATNGASRTIMPFVVIAGLDDSAAARFSSQRANELSVPWQMALTPGRAEASHDILTDRAFERLDFYNEIIRPTGCFYGAVIQMKAGDLSFHVNVCRERSAGLYHAGELDHLQETTHRLNSILSWQWRLQELSVHVETLEQAIDGLSDAVFLFDAWRRPMYLNNAAQALTALDGPFRLGSDGLVLQTASATRSLARMMTFALDEAAAPTSSTLRVAQQGGAPDMLVTVSRGPLPGYTPRGVRAARVAVVIQQADALAPIMEAEIAGRFGLTGREARIAVELAVGKSLAEIAPSLNIGMGTIRSHLKGIFGKTGVNSQASLVSLLLDGGRRIRRSQ